MSKNDTHYAAFYKTFLSEMPQRVPGNNDFAAQLEMLQENLSHDSDRVVLISTATFKIELNDQVTYWVGTPDASKVSLIVDTELFGKFCKIVLSSKNPNVPHGTPPFASDLYMIISADVSPGQLVLTSDNLMSTDAEKLWQGLVGRGNAVSVYDTTSRQYVLSPVKDSNELNNYVGGADKKRYVFVLSGSVTEQRGVIHTFVLMEIKRLAGWPLFESNKE